MKEIFKKYLPFTMLLLVVSAGGLYVSGAGKKVVDFTGDAVLGDSITHTWVNKVSTEKANLDSPEFTGTATASMPNDGDNSNRLATTARVTASAETGDGSGDWQCSYVTYDNTYPTCINPVCGTVCYYSSDRTTSSSWECVHGSGTDNYYKIPTCIY